MNIHLTAILVYIMFFPVAITATPLEDDYKLKAGDTLIVAIWGKHIKNQTTIISVDGKIILDPLGIISVGGLTLPQATVVITEVIDKSYKNVQRGVVLQKLASSCESK